MTTYTKVGPFTNGSAVPPIDKTFLDGVEAALAGSVGAAKVLAGTGIDLTGATVSTTAVQSFLDACVAGDTVTVPSGAIINLDATITINHRITMNGSGELRWTAGISNSVMINITVDGCAFIGMYLTNPNHLAAQTGNRTAGIHFTANSGRVIGCRIVGQQQAINVEANGEWHDFVFNDNLILDVPGNGDGPTNTTSAYGEDRGDGITVWGATATIVGNRVAALAGTDARIGIHVEQLASYEGTAYANGDSMCTIGSNVVTGQFRRGITSEGVTHTTIADNTIADATWYAINIVGTADNCVVSGNTIKVSRSSTDNQGSAWSPVRAGILIYDNPMNPVIRGNTIVVTGTGGGSAGIALQVGSGGNSTDAVIDGNTIDGGASNLFSNGVAVVNGANRIHVRNNVIKRFTGSGVTLADVDDPQVRGNYIRGVTGSPSQYGVVTSGAHTDGRVDQNTILSTVTAIKFASRTGLISASGNNIETATNGIDFTGWATSIVVMVALNNFYGTTNHLLNIPSGANTTVTNIGNN